MEMQSFHSHSLENHAFKADYISELAESALNQTENIIKNFPSRLTGTKQCKQSAEYLKNKFSRSSDSANIEEFEVHPAALLGFMKVIPVLYSISLILLIFSGLPTIIASIIMSFTAIYTLSQFVFYFQTFDWMHSKKTGYNVISEIIPKEDHEIKQQIIISGHHDSPYIFNYLENKKYQKYYAIRITSGIVAMVVCTIFSILKVIGLKGILMGIINIYLIISLIVVLPLFQFLNKKGSPGAGDNLIASAILLELADHYGKMKKNGQMLNNTRLIFGSFDAEECGLRGSRAYNSKNRKKLHSIPTISINMDSIFNYQDLQISTSDINGFLKCSTKLATEIHSVAQELGHKMSYFPMKFGGGGTDAAEFSRNKIESVSILALPTEFVREGLVYHTSRDTVDYIEKKAVEAIIEILINFIDRKDCLEKLNITSK